MMLFYRPYIIDLESTNGTYVNNNRIDPSRYVELKEKVIISLKSARMTCMVKCVMNLDKDCIYTRIYTGELIY